MSVTASTDRAERDGFPKSGDLFPEMARVRNPDRYQLFPRIPQTRQAQLALHGRRRPAYTRKVRVSPYYGGQNCSGGLRRYPRPRYKSPPDLLTLLELRPFDGKRDDRKTSPP